MNSSREKLDLIFFALSDRTRRGILARLSEGTSTVGSLSQPFSISAPAISRHMRILESAGLIRRKKSGRQHLCTLSTTGLKTAEDWLGFHRTFWESRLDALDGLLRKQNAAN